MSVSLLERDGLLHLIKYFGDSWRIVDVGANKGEWSDVLINYRDSSTEAGKYQVWLIEPNEMLLTYLQVKYDYNDHVMFCSFAIGATNETSQLFHYGLVRNSGLSSLVKNERWVNELGFFETTVQVYRLDDRFKNYSFDIIKLDIEGLEYDALLGAEQLMLEKRVKFIQVEYSEHYMLVGKGFKDVIKLANERGYKAWRWDGEYYVEQRLEDFQETYELSNFILTYLNIGRYQYTQLWNHEFKQNTQFLKKQVSLALEIGAFEGLTSNYICDELLKDKSSCRLICVDPLEEYYLKEGSDEVTNQMFVGQYERFMHNTVGQPIELQRRTSREAFPLLKDYLFDFVYVDGDHRKDEVYHDGCEAFKLLRRGGHILFDDYEWRSETKEGINMFLSDYATQLEVVSVGYQVLIRKR